MTTDARAGDAAEPLDARAERPARLARCLERARGGDIGALETVVRELNPLLWQVARAQGLAASDAADVVQTTWLELMKRLQEIRSPQALTAWLISTTKRGAWRANERTRRAGVGSGVPEEMPDPAPAADEGLIAGERHRALWRHFQQLSRRCRELLRIVAMFDRPDYAMVSDALEMPRGSIGPTRGRCLEKLREMLLADPAWSGR